MLHIHNGDSSAGTLRESNIEGEHLAFREALIEGAAPQGLSNEEWLLVRAKFLADDYAADFQECHDELLKQQEALLKATNHEEVVLWFEHDLFCQIHLVYLLTRFCEMNLNRTTLSLVCINEFPGKENFRGLGELNPQQMGGLFDRRIEVTDRQMQIAEQAWEAYSSPAPKALEAFLQQDTSALPFLKAALQKHLARFPSAKNGLGIVENKALELLRAGHQTFATLFPAFGNAEPVFGFGDTQFWNIVKRLAQANEPALTIGVEDVEGMMKSGTLIQAPIHITQFGEEVLSGKRDFIHTNGLDFWLGGVHLTPNHLWRWQEETQTLGRDDSRA
jgi:hypothetical protein